jgi:radical SAM superfamily enzyme YgiQ (UPF0313 family)
MIEKETGKSRRADIHWHFEVRAELLNREQARRFARLGASLQIGLQTADPAVATLINRSLNRSVFASKINILNQEGVIFGLDLIYGLPGDTLAGYRKSLDFALSLYPNNLDMFRLSVLPGTALADSASALNLDAEPTAPYHVRGTPTFSAADLVRAERLSRGVDYFYNRGRAVAWFNQILRPLRMRPAVFFEGFADYLEERVPVRSGMEIETKIEMEIKIEANQLAYLEKCYLKAGKLNLFPAVRDIVHYHGAWGRALAEGAVTEIVFAYHPGDILCPEALDLEAYLPFLVPRPVKMKLVLGSQGPELRPLHL